MTEYIDKEAALSLVQPDAPEDEKAAITIATAKKLIRSIIQRAPSADVEKMSDGYHTFADLYEQRLILSAALAKNNPNAWKSKRHEDGSVPFGGGWFIMGFDTDEGCYTYHYELKYWDLFQCEEVDKGRPWDGHTSKDVRRLLSIPDADVAPVVRCIDCKYWQDNNGGYPHEECRWGHGETPEANDFCSYGEQKDGDDDAKEN